MKLRELSCFQRVIWRPDRAELHRFALAMVVGFALLGSLAAWHSGGIHGATQALWTAGLVLALAALVPGLGRVAYLAVYVPASLAGFVISHLVLVAIFFLVFVPLGLALRLAGRDLLSLRLPAVAALWRRADSVQDPASYYRQF